MKQEVIAVDFDGTLCKNQWPKIGNPRYDMINWIKDLQKLGHKVILWTCREGLPLVEAITWCADHGLFFDAVNDNLEDHKRKFGGNSRKVLADFYVDDKAIYPSGMPFAFEKNRSANNKWGGDMFDAPGV